MTDKSIWCAVYISHSNPDNYEDDIDSLNVPFEFISKTQHEKIAYYELENFAALNAFLMVCGKKTKLGGDVFAASVTIDRATQIYDQFVPNIEQRLKGSNLDLSNVRSISPNTVMTFDAAYICLLVAMYCAEMDLHTTIETIDFSNNGITKEYFIRFLPMFFNQLKAVSFANNVIGNNIKHLQEMLAPHNIKLVEDPSQLEREAVRSIFAPSSYFGREGWLYNARQQAHIDLLDTEEATLDSFPLVEIVPEAFPTNQFIIDFLQTGWESCLNLRRFYAPTCMFSLTAEQCSGASAISQVLGVVRNDLDSTDDGPQFGVEAAVSLQSELFPEGFCARPSELVNAAIAGDAFAVILHGVWANTDGAIYGFDRSFIIGANDEGVMLITNDNLFLKDIKR